MMVMLNKMKDKLERESNDHKQVRLQVAELFAQLQQLSTVRSTARLHSSSVICDSSFTHSEQREVFVSCDDWRDYKTHHGQMSVMNQTEHG